ncbi:MAG: ABC transporter ATP-binding protein, partial [Dehalococcoidales bacterium]|nr:ABC transporter ATP-binding protein [Dehalococcoidales bacterium]
DSVALVGPNGAGKSTLILHFNGIIRSDGNVRFMGKPIDDKNLKWVRSKVGLVFQNPDDQLFSPTVFDDVAFGPINMGYGEIEVRDAVKKALALVGMSGFEKRSPHHLSIGEKKRIAIATVLSMSPEVLVIDEPSSSLDPKSKWDFIDFLKNLSWTKIIVSHDLELVGALCSRIVIMEKGSIVADGFTRDILSDRKLLAKHGLAQGK